MIILIIIGNSHQNTHNVRSFLYVHEYVHDKDTTSGAMHRKPRPAHTHIHVGIYNTRLVRTICNGKSFPGGCFC